MVSFNTVVLVILLKQGILQHCWKQIEDLFF